MSLETLRPSNSDQHRTLFASKQDNAFETQRQERRNTAEELTGEMSGTGAGTNADISASQKMISATWGSILTSLLGMMLHIARTSIGYASDIYASHTSRCSSGPFTVASPYNIAQLQPKLLGTHDLL